jgi:hypothetical protein
VPDPTRPPEVRPISAHAAELVRLLSAVVDVVAGYDRLDEEPVLAGAVNDAAVALHGLCPASLPGIADESRRALAATVAELPDRWAT